MKILPPSKIFVTGATSHTGWHLIQRLYEEGYALHCLTRFPGKKESIPFGTKSIGDIRDVEFITSQIEGSRAVIHLAHMANARAITAACTRASVRRLIAISSTRKYTKFPDATSRWVEEGEEAVRKSILHWTIIRPSMIFGDSRDQNLTALVEAAQKRKAFPLVGGGKALMQPVFVDDLVEAIIQTLRRPETVGRDYDIAGPEPITLRNMIQIIGEESGSKMRLIPVPGKPAFLAARLWDFLRGAKETGLASKIRRLGEEKVFDISSAQEDLGYSPHTFRESIQRKLEWIREGR